MGSAGSARVVAQPISPNIVREGTKNPPIFQLVVISEGLTQGIGRLPYHLHLLVQHATILVLPVESGEELSIEIHLHPNGKMSIRSC